LKYYCLPVGKQFLCLFCGFPPVGKPFFDDHINTMLEKNHSSPGASK
jgi:hypothetical protein